MSRGRRTRTFPGSIPTLSASGIDLTKIRQQPVRTYSIQGAIPARGRSAQGIIPHFIHFRHREHGSGLKINPYWRPRWPLFGRNVWSSASFLSCSTAPVDVSVLLGTVNRTAVLKECIRAIQESLSRSNLAYEIVVAYGTEEDTSLPWLRNEPHVVAIYGGMDGAIDAFNRAYNASRGRFICQINDDVLVDGDSIARSVSHLLSDASAAGVVFRYDRGDGRGYHSDEMAGALHPNQMVVRRETCEAVIERLGAFWGDAHHRTDATYGGDSAFGLVCRYLGLRLINLEGVTCRDLLTQDATRARNASMVDADHFPRWQSMFQGYMTETAPGPRFDEWPNCYVPRVGMAPRRSPISAGRPLRVLSMPIVVDGWPQNAMREALRQIGPTVEILHEGVPPPGAAVQIAREHNPDLVFAQIQRPGWQEFARELRQAVGPHCTMVQWNGDVRTDANQPVDGWISWLAESFDLLLSDNCTYPKKLAGQGIRAGYLGIGFESDLIWEPYTEESQKVVFIGTNYVDLDGGRRDRLFSQIAEALPGQLALYGQGWTGAPACGPVDLMAAGQIMRRAAVTISTSLFANLERYTSNRLKYACAAGAVVAVERFPDMEGLGLIPGHNCLAWTSTEELIGILREYARPEQAPTRQSLREKARALAVERFSWNRGVEELLAIVRDHRAQRGEI